MTQMTPMRTSTTRSSKTVSSTAIVADEMKESSESMSPVDLIRNISTTTSSIPAPSSTTLNQTRPRTNLVPLPLLAPRCDSNSLSIIFSFLMNKEFAAAIRVNYQWYSTAEMNTSWPPFKLESFIHQLESENYSGAGQRRLVLHSPEELSDSLSHHIMRKANDVRLSYRCSQRLPIRLAEFPHLTALNVTFSGGVMSTSSFTRLMKDRIRALIVSSHWTHLRTFGSLHEFCNLRVLVTNFPMESDQLEQLMQLEYLHVDHSNFITGDNIFAIRYLSVYHQLRYVSIEWSQTGRYYKQVGTDLILNRHTFVPSFPNSLAIFPQPVNLALQYLTLPMERPLLINGNIKQPMPPTRLFHFGINGVELRDPFTILSIQDLTQLSFTVFDSYCHFESKCQVGLSRLTQISLRISSSYHFAHLTFLRHCTSLKSLHLTMKRTDGSSRGCRLGVEPRYWPPQLEELSVAYPLILSAPSIEALYVCKHLHRLDLSNRPIVDLDQLAPILAQLPEFQILELTVWPPESNNLNELYDPISASSSFALPTSLMHHVSYSSTWSSLHLHLIDDILYPLSTRRPWSIDSSQLSLRVGGRVNEVTAKRFRLQVHSSTQNHREQIYRVTTNGLDGQQSWTIV